MGLRPTAERLRFASPGRHRCVRHRRRPAAAPQSGQLAPRHGRPRSINHLVPAGPRLARLDHVVIAITDWERSNRFYAEVLGAELVSRGEGWAYRLGEQQLN